MLTLFSLLLMALASRSQELAIIPKPVHSQWGTGSFSLNRNTVLVLTSEDQGRSASFLNEYLQQCYGFRLKTTQAPQNGAITLSTTPSSASAREGRYVLEVTASGIRIEGDTYQGTFYGIQTLIQLLPTEVSGDLAIPVVSIEDYPRFGYRGLMLDVGRHFFSVDFIKRYLDFIALHKMNTFHWHLTDDQGWRIEIKKYPLLTQTGGCRNGTIIGHHPGTGNDNTPHCGYYTQDQVRDIVKYAADRFITVIPEIEMPGHSSAAIAAYPGLSCFPEEPTEIAKGVVWAGTSSGKQVQQSWGVYRDVYCPSDYTFGFLQDVLDEVMALFPSKYIHIGGDECPKDFWKKSSFCQSLIKARGLKDEHGLQSYFIQTMEKYINSKGRSIIGWDEILEGGLAPNATVMSWRGEEGGIDAARQNHDVVMTPGKYVYLDHPQTKKEDSLTIGGYLPLETVYNYEPIPSVLTPEEGKHVLGAQGNVWTEYMANPAKVEYMLFPRLSALSEVLWSEKETRNYDQFLQRLQTQYKRYQLWKVTFNRALN